MKRTGATACAALAGAILLSATGPTPLLAGRAAQVRVRSFEALNEGVSAYKRGDYALAVERLTESTSMALNSFRLQRAIQLLFTVGMKTMAPAHPSRIL